MAGPTRQTIIAIEKGSLSVAMQAYARPLGALDCEFALARRWRKSRECSADAMPATLEQLLGIVPLSRIVGNGDAHLKNFGRSIQDRHGAEPFARTLG